MIAASWVRREDGVVMTMAATAVGALMGTLLIGGALVVAGSLSADEGGVAGAAGPAITPRIDVGADELDRLPAGRRLLVRAADAAAPRVDGRVYELSHERGVEPAGRLVCKQVHASRLGPGLCLALAPSERSYEAIVFDADRKPRLRFPIQGVPDRARVSRDGKLAGYTTFDRGSSQGYFANTSGFSVDTRIVDLATGDTVLYLDDRLEVVRRDGKPFRPVDVEYWGVTFGRGGRFLATMGDVFDHYLIAGDARSSRVRILAKGIECPSLSPDGRRIAYKRRVPYSDTWRFHVRDLSSGRDVALAETRSIDDQPEWLDDDRIVYSDDKATFVVPADGRGEPKRLARGATSPASL